MPTATIQFYNGGTKTYNVADNGNLDVSSDWENGIGSVSFSGSGTINIIGNGHTINLTQAVNIASGVTVNLNNVTLSASSDIIGGNVVLQNSTLTINGTSHNSGTYPTSINFDNSNGYSTLNVIGCSNSSSVYNSNVNIFNLTPGDNLIIGNTSTKDVEWKQESDGSYSIYKSGSSPSYPTYMKVMGGIHLADNITPDMFEYNESTGTIVCYLRGSMVATSKGIIPVEKLTAGMLVKTLNGFKKIVWTGSGNAKVNKKNPHADFAGYPVLIRKDAIVENVPDNDLYVTSEHSIYLDNHLIPIRMLVNGTSIKYVEMEEYEFFHFECENHEVVFVNNLKSESYLNTGNKKIFGNYKNEAIKTSDDLVAPIITPDRSKIVYNELLKRSNDLFNDSIAENVRKSKQIFLEKNNKKVYPFKQVGNNFVFMIPKDFADFSVNFNRIRLSDLIGPWMDDRNEIEVSDLARSDKKEISIMKVSVKKDNVSLKIDTSPEPCIVSITF